MTRADIRNCFLRVTTSTSRYEYMSVAQAVDDVKTGVLVINYNPHPEAHGPDVRCGRCPSPGSGMSIGALMAEARARKGNNPDDQ